MCLTRTGFTSVRKQSSHNVWGYDGRGGDNVRVVAVGHTEQRIVYHISEVTAPS